jgi:CubicO group peptidase (beta-lactamase class C family)
MPHRSFVARAVVAGAAALSLAGPATAQPLPDDQRQSVDKVFTAYDKGDAPGCALAVYRNGEIAYARGYGLASLEHRVPITPKTVFDIGSTSKQFTAFSILLLERDGKLSLDDDVRKHVPELQPIEPVVTIRHLVLHTSGLRDYLTLWALAGMKTENWTTQADAVRLVARQRRGNFPAGAEWLYSNTGYLLLGEIVTRVSGQSLREFAAARIFKPLGMTHTFFLDTHTEVIPARATGYAPREGGGFSVEMSDFEQTGDGAVQTTVEDLLRWDSNFYDPKVGDRPLLERAQSVGTLTGGKKLDYAAGLMIGAYRGLPTVRHGGAWAGYRADLLRFPTAKTSVACLCNLGSTNPSALADSVADIVLASQLAPKAGITSLDSRPAFPVSAVRLESLAGFYENAATGAFRRLTVKDGALVALGQRLKPVAPDRFVPQAPGVEIYFPPAAAGGRQEMRVIREDRDPEMHRRVDPPTGANLADFAGTYYSDELDAAWTLAVRDGRLTAQVLNDPPMELAIVKPDVFVADQGLVLRFEREGGAVKRASVQAGRVTNLAITRR